MVLPNPAGIERSEPFCDCGVGAYSRRRSHIAKRLLIACRESDLRSNLTALPANQLLTTDRQTTTPRTNHFVLPTLSFRATDFFAAPTDFSLSPYGVTVETPASPPATIPTQTPNQKQTHFRLVNPRIFLLMIFSFREKIGKRLAKGERDGYARFPHALFKAARSRMPSRPLRLSHYPPPAC